MMMNKLKVVTTQIEGDSEFASGKARNQLAFEFGSKDHRDDRQDELEICRWEDDGGFIGRDEQ